MSDPLVSDVEHLRAALEKPSDEVLVTLNLPRASAEKVLALLDAERTTGAVVIPVREEVTTTEAVAMLGLSRPTLMKLIAAGEIDHIKVGSHHRIPTQAVLDYQRARAGRRERAAQALADFSNEIGFID